MKARVETAKDNPYFITFEGIDGCGKSTHAILTYEYLSSFGYKVKLLREPGSTIVAEKIREILLDKKNSITDTTELFLYEAARAEISGREITPLLKKGYIVLCDRFYDSTTAYQGYARGLGVETVEELNSITSGGVVPALTFFVDCYPATALNRVDSKPDRL